LNASTRFFRSLWLLAIALPALGQPHPELVTAEDQKSALYDVLSHNNLFDAKYLSDRLGIGLHIVRRKADPSMAKLLGPSINFDGTPTTNPPGLYGSMEYSVGVDEARQTPSVRLSLAARSCAPLQQWGAEWHIKTTQGFATDGGPFYESLAWPANNGINLMVTPGPFGCGIEMSQNVGRAISVAVSPKLPRSSASKPSMQIAELLLSDLRKVEHVGDILNTEFVIKPAKRTDCFTTEAISDPRDSRIPGVRLLLR
jgi:hypothetical protein